MEQNEALLSVIEDVRRAAVQVGRDWAAVTDAEEVEQEITLALLANNQATVVAEMDPDERRVALRKVGQQFASRARMDFDYFTGNFRYSTREVRSILEDGGMTGERVQTSTERLDLDEGLTLLRSRNAGYAEAIGRRYLVGEQAADATARKHLTRAVDALTDAMNNVHRNRARAYTEGPGTRPAVKPDFV